jgi:DNA-binding winged helix-turn-helix (wHTH) protein
MAPRHSRIFLFHKLRFDEKSGELTNNGRVVRLPDQSSRLLTYLLQRPGLVVLREEMREYMWPEGEHLDHDHSINNAVNQLRRVFRDDSRSPIFIETIPKRGYRFLPTVTEEPCLTLSQRSSS